MNRTPAVIAACFVAIATFAVTAVHASAGRVDKECRAEVRAAGDWGQTLSPGKATFITGTEGDDVIERIEPGVVFCGLGGDDVVIENLGWFYGGDGLDVAHMNMGVVDGGAETDIVIDNRGEFRGRGSRDVVFTNNGLFNGGPGLDSIEVENNGTCVDVELGC